jgi:N utilization substance protein B
MAAMVTRGHKKTEHTTKEVHRRSTARLCAVQALYQMDMVATPLAGVTEEFLSHRLGAGIDGEIYSETDKAFFVSLVEGVVAEQTKIDVLIDENLATGWRLERIDSTLRAILRAACYELLQRDDIPTRVVIDEYIDVAHAFFSGDEPGVVNAVLDNLAKKLHRE